MFEKVNPCHPDKVADRVAGAIVDLAYEREEMPKVAVEVLLGHGYGYVVVESSVEFTHDDVMPIIKRITKGQVHTLRLLSVRQDVHLAENQDGAVRCGDNGIFRGVPVSNEERDLSLFARKLFEDYPSDGKFVLDNDWGPRTEGDGNLFICQSEVDSNHELFVRVIEFAPGRECFAGMTLDRVKVNPLGPWTGGLDVDCGATNRKLGSDMGRAVTGGGLHGKDLSKADVSVNIVCHLLAQKINMGVSACCAIGDETVRFINDCGETIQERPYADVVARAGEYIREQGGFEKFAEWGLI